jgi:excisionase family DNA binding protein
MCPVGDDPKLLKLLYTPEESAEVLGQSRSTVFAKIATGELASVKIGRSRRVTRQALEDFVAGLVAGQK